MQIERALIFQEKERYRITLAAISEGVIATNAAGEVEYTTWKVSSFAGRQGLRLSGWHQHLQYFITGFALGKISLA